MDTRQVVHLVVLHCPPPSSVVVAAHIDAVYPQDSDRQCPRETTREKCWQDLGDPIVFRKEDVWCLESQGNNFRPAYSRCSLLRMEQIIDCERDLKDIVTI